MNLRHRTVSILCGVAILVLASCSAPVETATSLPSDTVTVESASPTVDSGVLPATKAPAATTGGPTATQFPLAARVNGEAIPLAFYEAELVRFRSQAGTGLATYAEEMVLEDLINQVLLAQASREAGFLVDETLVETRIQALGLSETELQDWLAANAYTPEDFRQAMAWSIAAAWMRDQISAQVPDTADQVHARQILLYNSTDADAAYARLQAGEDFETLAAEYDPVTKGSLGWFPRGYLNVTELDEVVFNLKAGAYSPVIHTPLGYHIVQLLERDSQHPLTADARRTLQAQAVSEWLQAQRGQSEIIILEP
jgi:peptidyl-prolyl cis-trans isomerase C